MIKQESKFNSSFKCCLKIICKSIYPKYFEFRKSFWGFFETVFNLQITIYPKPLEL